MLVALKCDLRENHAEDEDEMGETGTERREKETIDYKQGLEVARRIQALRYLGRRPPPRHRWADAGRCMARGCGLMENRVLGDEESRRQRGVC